MSNITLFSGGEKALIAISCLFAILKVRPVPMCILDEVEAALDMANVERFAKFLREFSKQTQFIVVTHREERWKNVICYMVRQCNKRCYKTCKCQT